MSLPTIPSAHARALLVPYSFAQFSEIVSDDSIRDTQVRYVNYLVARGNIDEVRAYLDTLTEETQRDIVDSTHYNTYYGNTLNTCAYWMTGESAIEMFRMLVERGATAIWDHYGDLPWEVGGVMWISSIGNEITPCERNPDEFLDTHYILFNRFHHLVPGCFPPQPPRVREPNLNPESLVEQCSLHNSRSMYTPNTSGYYSMYAPPCNGCIIGREEER